MEVTANVQGNYSNLEQNLAEKEKLCHLKRQKKPVVHCQQPFQSSSAPKYDN